MGLRIDTSVLGKGREETRKIAVNTIESYLKTVSTSGCKVALKTFAAVSNTATSVFLQYYYGIEGKQELLSPLFKCASRNQILGSTFEKPDFQLCKTY